MLKKYPSLAPEVVKMMTPDAGNGENFVKNYISVSEYSHVNIPSS